MGLIKIKTSAESHKKRGWLGTLRFAESLAFREMGIKNNFRKEKMLRLQIKQRHPRLSLQMEYDESQVSTT